MLPLLPPFDAQGVLPPGDYPMTFDALKNSHLVTGEKNASLTWDTAWRGMLVENLQIMTGHLWQAGIDEIFIDGSFVEDKDHPSDIDGYFHCDLMYLLSGDLQTKLNDLDPYKTWRWKPESRRYDKDSHKKQLPMWHQYLVELYPHFSGLPCGIPDEFGNDQQFPAAFRKTRWRETPQGLRMLPKGIVQIVKG